MTSLEKGLAVTLTQTSKEIAHSECLDIEQRAEVYSIIEAIRANSQTHQAVVRQLAEKLKGTEGNA
jgi:hypothetical protein